MVSHGIKMVSHEIKMVPHEIRMVSYGIKMVSHEIRTISCPQRLNFPEFYGPQCAVSLVMPPHGPISTRHGISPPSRNDTNTKNQERQKMMSLLNIGFSDTSDKDLLTKGTRILGKRQRPAGAFDSRRRHS